MSERALDGAAVELVRHAVWAEGPAPLLRSRDGL
jgi:hypothetical protein